MATGISKTKWNSGQLEDAVKRADGLALVYEDKLPEAQILASRPSQYTCLYQKDDSNRLYYSDNLSVLASLYQNSAWRGQVRLIYIDPPYATGNVFQSRNQEDAYTDLLSGARYVEFIRQRLVFLRELLAEDGSIYVHLDANMVFHIKIIMDELFGESNFRGCITRKKCNPKNYTRRTYGNISDYILFYSKSDNYVWNRPYDEWEQENSEKEYPYIEEETGRRYKKVPVHAPGVRSGATGQPWREKLPPPGKHWQYTPSRLDEMDARGEIYWSPTGNPRRKVYLDESQGKPAQDIWLDFKDAHNQNIQITGYPTEKNPDLMARLIQASSNPGDIVLDCFAGSGTTLLVADQLDRRWIGVDNSQHALATILKRFAVGSKIMGDFVNANGPNKKVGKPERPPRTLFDLLEEQTEQNETLPKKVASHAPITQFSLYAPTNQAGDLTGIVQEWLTERYGFNQ